MVPPHLRYSIVDVAGLDDSFGLFVDIINQMLNKRIFQMTEGVKIISIVTKDELFE